VRRLPRDGGPGMTVAAWVKLAILAAVWAMLLWWMAQPFG
jgi:hypothetical protein